MCDGWLPPLMRLSEYGGNWEGYLAALHQEFERDFVHSKPRWLNKRVGLKRHPEYDGKSATFWHLISEGATEDERTPDLRRCERIRWPRPMMDSHDGLDPESTQAHLLWWSEQRGRDDRILLALHDFSYVMVVADRGDFVLPWTAYCVDRSHRRDKLRRRYQEFWKAQNG